MWLRQGGTALPGGFMFCSEALPSLPASPQGSSAPDLWLC